MLGRYAVQLRKIRIEDDALAANLENATRGLGLLNETFVMAGFSNKGCEWGGHRRTDLSGASEQSMRGQKLTT